MAAIDGVTVVEHDEHLALEQYVAEEENNQAESMQSG